MKLNLIIMIMAGMVLSISFLIFGIVTSTEVTSTIAQVIGFSGMVFTFLYGLLMNRTTNVAKVSE